MKPFTIPLNFTLYFLIILLITSCQRETSSNTDEISNNSEGVIKQDLTEGQTLELFSIRLRNDNTGNDLDFSLNSDEVRLTSNDTGILTISEKEFNDYKDVVFELEYSNMIGERELYIDWDNFVHLSSGQSIILKNLYKEEVKEIVFTVEERNTTQIVNEGRSQEGIYKLKILGCIKNVKNSTLETPKFIEKAIPFILVKPIDRYASDTILTSEDNGVLEISYDMFERYKDQDLFLFLAQNYEEVFTGDIYKERKAIQPLMAQGELKLEGLIDVNKAENVYYLRWSDGWGVDQTATTWGCN